MAAHFTYEEHLDEVTTQITEHYKVNDKKAISMVMRAKENDFFSGHDDDPKICTLERAVFYVMAVFKTYGKKTGRLS